MAWCSVGGGRGNGMVRCGGEGGMAWCGVGGRGNGMVQCGGGEGEWHGGCATNPRAHYRATPGYTAS